MRKLMALVLGIVLLAACNSKTDKNTEVSEVEEVVEEMAYQSFGEDLSDTKVWTETDMREKFKSLKSGDTVNMAFSAKVNSVCQKMGCWMRLDLGEEKEALVKFKDYGFFVPKDIADQEVIVEGVAFIEETDVETLKHFAEDAGKTPEEIAAITEPEKVYSFISSGVRIPEKY